MRAWSSFFALCFSFSHIPAARQLGGAMQMSEPGFYKTNYRALSFRELARMRGLLRLPLAYLINNTKTAFDSVPRQEVVRILSDDVAFIYRRFVDAVQRRGEPPRRFPDQQALRDWFDSNALEVFSYRVRRGLVARMSDGEVAVARRRMPPPLPNR